MTSLRMLSEPGCVCLVGVECSFSLRDPGIVLRGLLLSRRVFCLSRADSLSYMLETGEESRIPRLVSGVTTTSVVAQCLALASLAYGHF